MSTFFPIRLEPMKGAFTGIAFQEALWIATTLSREVRFTFNEIEMVVQPGEAIHNIYARYDEVHMKRRNARYLGYGAGANASQVSGPRCMA